MCVQSWFQKRFAFARRDAWGRKIISQDSTWRAKASISVLSTEFYFNVWSSTTSAIMCSCSSTLFHGLQKGFILSCLLHDGDENDILDTTLSILLYCLYYSPFLWNISLNPSSLVFLWLKMKKEEIRVEKKMAHECVCNFCRRNFWLRRHRKQSQFAGHLFSAIGPFFSTVATISLQFPMGQKCFYGGKVKTSVFLFFEKTDWKRCLGWRLLDNVKQSRQ